MVGHELCTYIYLGVFFGLQCYEVVVFCNDNDMIMNC